MDVDKYKGKYRISSTRLQTWDYGRNAAYFITICTYQRRHVFGTAVDGRIDLTPLGQAAWDCWYAIPEHFPFVLLDVFVAMPNHVHGMVIIDKPSLGADGALGGVDLRGVETQDNALCDVETQDNALCDVETQDNALCDVETQDIASLPIHGIQPQNRFGPQSKNLASIVRGFKIGVTKYARQHRIEFAWQTRYHDHIVRSAAEYQRIRTYIVEHPLKWSADTYNHARA